ncbi:MAG TPA: zf-HC2 domain-containing protein [Planctomycetota bacterium]|nr:zf-HC2 domain-containing protein [Planctomycetota bacterium]
MKTPRCHEVRGAFDAWLDGAADPVASAALVDHLAECPLCAAAAADDVRLGEAVELAFRAGARAGAAEPLPQARTFVVGRRVAAAITVFALCGASYLAGARGASTEGPVGTPTPRRNGVDAGEFTEQLIRQVEHERFENLSQQLRSSEARRIGLEVEVLAGGDARGEGRDLGAVVRDLARRRREAGENPSSRVRQDLWWRTRATARVLKSDPVAAVRELEAWIASSASEDERRAAVRLVGMLPASASFDALAREAAAGPAREAALDALARQRDERSRAVLAATAAAKDVVPEIRVAALGGLHRRGDSAATERLVEEFRAQGADTELRRRIVYHLAARVSSRTAERLPHLVDACGMDRGEREAFAELLHAAGDDAARGVAERIIF